MSAPLVIVESPAKARTIAGLLGDEFDVESSVGHIRDLPERAGDVPAAFRDEPWTPWPGVDVDNDFKPLYVINADSRQQVQALKRKLADASELYLATDEDREGEAIAWHLTEVLNPQVPVHRMVFHEITEDAINDALENLRDLDRRLVDAQEARRILDRLYGYELSDVVRKKVGYDLSAGRVQSVATRIVVERERERMRFRAAQFWDIEGTFSPQNGDEAPAGGPGAAPASFTAKLAEVDGNRIATGKDFDDAGERIGDVVVLDEAAAVGLATDLAGADFAVRSVEKKPYNRKPYAPFRTSTLQQEAGRKLRFSSARAMKVAQSLYQNGYITYMRTDSTTLSDAALRTARAQIAERYGPEFLPDSPRRYTRKVRNAQEAHEAIRPAGEVFRTPSQVPELGADERRLYELIWKRTVASQMTDARLESVQVRLGATSASGRDAEFAASGRTILHPGFLRAYVEASDDPEAELEDQERLLPDLAEGDPLHADELEATAHNTQPPARYTEASLVRRLEELGVGRPSTYESIIAKIVRERGYVWKKGSALVPSFTAFAVVTLLEQHFADLVDYAFTARMEDDLDGIASGEQEMVPWLSRFYLGGNGDESLGLRATVEERFGEIDAREVNSIPIGVTDDGRPVVARVGRYGPFLQRGTDEDKDTVSIPEDVPPDELTIERAVELLDAPSGDRSLGRDPETGLEVLVRSGRFGPYVQLGEADADDEDKPRTASLLDVQTPETLGIEDALALLTLPRVVGVDPADDGEITVQNGRYGPYLKKGSETRSLDREDQLFTIGLDECLRLLAEPKRRGRRSTAPLRELGDDPNSGTPMLLRDGRYGPYVTDGEYNASLRTGDSVESLTPERAAELLAERRARGPAKKGAAAKKKAKAATTKKTTKKATKKSAAKKGARKQAAKKR